VKKLETKLIEIMSINALMKKSRNQTTRPKSLFEIALIDKPSTLSTEQHFFDQRVDRALFPLKT
jgi:hypothetical protein